MKLFFLYFSIESITKFVKSFTVLLDIFFISLSFVLNLIKIDVEGYELNVLKGASQTLKNLKPKLFIELDNSNLQRQGHSASELIKFLNQFNYTITNANNNKHVNFNDNFDNCHFDIICI